MGKRDKYGKQYYERNKQEIQIKRKEYYKNNRKAIIKQTNNYTVQK